MRKELIPTIDRARIAVNPLNGDERSNEPIPHPLPLPLRTKWRDTHNMKHRQSAVFNAYSVLLEKLRSRDPVIGPTESYKM